MLFYSDRVILMYFSNHTGPFNVRATNRLSAFTDIPVEVLPLRFD